jgi:hypothetical protein
MGSYKKLLFNLIGILSLAVSVATMGPNGRVAEAENIFDPAIFDVLPASAPFGPGIETSSAFHFLQPITVPSGDPSKFDPDLLNFLTVDICTVTTTGCDPIIQFISPQIRITSSGGYGSFYIVNWDTSKSNFNSKKTFRVSVKLVDEVLGSVDLAPSMYSSFGRTWPIKFMIEKDPALRVILFRSLRKSCSQVASMLKNDFGLSQSEVEFYLADGENPCSQDEIDVAISGVFQDVVIPPTTKITDESTRNGLASYDPDSGRMVFVETPLLKKLKSGDVLVSEPGPGAPYGYLRKIMAVQRSRGIVTLGTVQAKLTEAISKGTLNAAGELKPNGGAPATSVSADGARATEGRPSAETDIGDVFNFQKDIDVTVNLEGGDDELGGTGTVRVQGSVYLNAGYNLGLGIESCFEVPPVCVDRVEAWAGVEQKSRLKVTGEFVGKLHKEQVIDRLPIDPIVFFIGPVPVVLVPSVNIVLGVDGEARINFSFEAEARTKIKVGAKWTDPDDNGVGWENISEYNPLDKLFFDADIDGTIRMDAFGKIDAKLLLYGVIGPGMDGSLGIGGIAQSNTKPLWKIYGHVNTNVNVSVDAIGFFGIGDLWSQEVFNTFFDIQEAPNLDPECSWATDTISAEIGQIKVLGPRSGFVGHFECSDPEGDSLTYTAASGNTSDGTNGVIPLSYAFLSSGLRTVTVTAHDSDGGHFSFPLKIDVHNSLPVVNVIAGSTAEATVPFSMTAEAFDPDTNVFLPCSAIDWSAPPDTVTERDGGCSGVVSFAAPGAHTVTVTATDQYGGVGTKSISVNVLPAPANRPPAIDYDSVEIHASSPKGGGLCFLNNNFCLIPPSASAQFLWPGFGSQASDEWGVPLTMWVEATDPEGDEVHYQWVCQNQSGTQVVIATHVDDNVYRCTPPYVPGELIQIFAIVSDDTPRPTNTTTPRTFFYRVTPN